MLSISLFGWLNDNVMYVLTDCSGVVNGHIVVVVMSAVRLCVIVVLSLLLLRLLSI